MVMFLPGQPQRLAECLAHTRLQDVFGEWILRGQIILYT